MKKILFLCLLSCLLFPCSLLAQDWTVQEISEDGKPSHNVYLTNRWRDNLFVGATAGISTRFTMGSKSDITSTYANPDINVFILKWFAPQIGLRLGYQGINGREGLNSYTPFQINHTPFGYKLDSTGEFVESATEPGVLHYGLMHIHGDVMWNITNTFAGFKRDRFFEISAYFFGGYLRIWDNKLGKKGSSYDQEFSLGLGAYATFMFTHRLVGVADLRFTNHASRYRNDNGARTNIAALSIGVAYNLCKTYWTNGNSVATSISQYQEAEAAARELLAQAEKDNTQLEKELEVLTTQLDDTNELLAQAEKDNTQLEKELEVLTTQLDDTKQEKEALQEEVESVPYEIFKVRANEADLVLYFYINQSTLNFSEIHHLEGYVKQVLAIEPDHVFKVTGSADKGTGTEERNRELSQARANYVKSILVDKFGVKPENVITSSVVTDKNIEAALDRCALIER